VRNVDGYIYDHVTIGAHVPMELKRQVAELAHDSRRSLSAEVRSALENHVELRQQREEGGARVFA
jgi:predicted transcriptional regulator